MNRIRLLAAATVLMFALSMGAQQTAQSPDNHAAAAAVANVDQHLKMISEKLALTPDQEAKARPILQQMHDESQKLQDDTTLTPEQRQAAMHPIFMKADQQMREFLTDDQKKKLDEMEAQMHHSRPSSSTPSDAHSASPQI
jgi:Spy/CpxP family protein refolding chaperone